MLKAGTDSFSFAFDLIRSGALAPYAVVYPDKTAKPRRVEPRRKRNDFPDPGGGADSYDRIEE